MIRADQAIQGVHAKGGCYLCGSPNKLVDTEVSIDYEGVLAICEGCCHDLAMTAGFHPEVRTEDYDRLAAHLARTEQERNEMERLVADIDGGVKAAVKRHRERQRKAALKEQADATA